MYVLSLSNMGSFADQIFKLLIYVFTWKRYYKKKGKITLCRKIVTDTACETEFGILLKEIMGWYKEFTWQFLKFWIFTIFWSVELRYICKTLWSFWVIIIIIIIIIIVIQCLSSSTWVKLLRMIWFRDEIQKFHEIVSWSSIFVCLSLVLIQFLLMYDFTFSCQTIILFGGNYCLSL